MLLIQIRTIECIVVQIQMNWKRYENLLIVGENSLVQLGTELPNIIPVCFRYSFQGCAMHVYKNVHCSTMLFLVHLLINSQVLKGVLKLLFILEKKWFWYMKINVYHLQYSLLHQVYKYLKANTFNDQGTNPSWIEQITRHLSWKGLWAVYGSWKRDVCLLLFF